MANMGAYKCKAENAKGSDETQGKITIKPVSDQAKAIFQAQFLPLAIFEAIELSYL